MAKPKTILDLLTPECLAFMHTPSHEDANRASIG